MPRPRKPTALAKIMGTHLKHPERYRKRKEPRVREAVGEPPEWLSAGQAQAWDTIRLEVPWLNRSHRSLLLIASVLAAKLAAGALSDSGGNVLRLCLSMMGATPDTAHKVR